MENDYVDHGDWTSEGDMHVALLSQEAKPVFGSLRAWTIDKPAIGSPLITVNGIVVHVGVNVIFDMSRVLIFPEHALPSKGDYVAVFAMVKV